MVVSEYLEGMRLWKGRSRFTYEIIMCRTEKSVGGGDEMRL